MSVTSRSQVAASALANSPCCCYSCLKVCVPACMTDLLGEHLQEIRALRQRLEESIRTNDRLREQLERRLAEVEKDPGERNEHCASQAN